MPIETDATVGLAPGLAGRAANVLAVFLFPVLLTAAVCNQPRPYPLITRMGELTSVLSIAMAGLLLLTTFPRRFWPWGILGFVLALRFQRLVSPSPSSVATLTYAFAVSLLFAAAGAVILARHPKLIRNQLTAFIVASGPLMLIQLSGVSAWAHVLRTDLHTYEDRLYQMVPVLFVPPEAVVITTLQARPAGFLHANNFLSLFLAFAMALYFGRPSRGRIAFRDVMVVGVLTLAMSKTAFVVFVLMMVAMSVTGDRAQRTYALSLTGLLVVELVAYRTLFPGLFAYTASLDLALLNLELRIADILLASGNPTLTALANEWLPLAVARLEPSKIGAESAYALIAASGAAVVSIAVLTPLYLRALRRFGRRNPDWRMAVMLSAIALGVVPAMTSFLGSTAMAFLCGFAVLPLAAVWEPRFELLMRRALEAAAPAAAGRT